MIRIIVLMTSILSISIYANTAQNLSNLFVTTAAAGALVALNETQYEMWLKSELEGWKDTETKSTSSLAESCNMIVEARITGNRRQNVILFAVTNKSDETILVRPTDVKVVYSSGVERLANFPFDVSPTEVKPNWWMRSIVMLPHKNEFKNVDYIDVVIPFSNESGVESDCKVKVRLNRNKEVPEEKSTYTRGVYLDFAYMFGTNLFSSESQKELDTSSMSSISFNFNFYFNNYLGLSIGMLGSSYENNANTILESELNEKVDARFFSGYIGLLAKYEFKPKFILYYGGGYHSYSIKNLERDVGPEREVVSGGSYYLTIGQEYVFSRVNSGFWTGDYSVGLHYYHINISDEKINNVKLKGSLNPIMLTFRMAL